MPVARVFLDTKTLLYLHDRKDETKAGLVRAWIDALIEVQGAFLNIQVLNEATNAMLKKRWFETPGQVYAAIDVFAELGDSSIGWGEIAEARLLHVRYGYSWWDCLLLASALELRCTHFLSEDLQDGQSIVDGSRTLTIVNPFAHSPEYILSQ